MTSGPARSTDARAEAVIGPIESWSADGLEASRKIPEGAPDIDIRVRRILESGFPAMVGAVEFVGPKDRSLVVRFRPPARLEPKEVEGRVVECLLY
jgi:hypothetical protein